MNSEDAHLVAPLSPTKGASVGGEVAGCVHPPSSHHAALPNSREVLTAVAEPDSLGLAPLSERHPWSVCVPGPGSSTTETQHSFSNGHQPMRGRIVVLVA